MFKLKLFSILFVFVLFFSCGQQEILSPYEEEVQINFTNNFEVFEDLTDPSKRLPKNPCLANSLPIGNTTVVWESRCNETTGSGERSAVERLNSFFNGCLPKYTSDVCIDNVQSRGLVYFENDQDCEPVFNHLNFENANGVSPSELGSIASWLYQNAIATIGPGYVLLDVNIISTSVQNCLLDQYYDEDCSLIDGIVPNPCMSSVYDNLPDCTICKDFCETRTIALEIRFGQFCRVNPISQNPPKEQTQGPF